MSMILPTTLSLPLTLCADTSNFDDNYIHVAHTVYVKIYEIGNL
jgi:hypothetical protein